MKRTGMHPQNGKPPAGMSHATMEAGMRTEMHRPKPSKEKIQADMGIAPRKAKKKGSG